MVVSISTSHRAVNEMQEDSLGRCLSRAGATVLVAPPGRDCPANDRLIAVRCVLFCLFTVGYVLLQLSGTLSFILRGYHLHLRQKTITQKIN